MICIFVVYSVFEPEKNDVRVIKCIVGNGNHALKMADADQYFPEIIDNNRKRTCLLDNLYKMYGIALALLFHELIFFC